MALLLFLCKSTLSPPSASAMFCAKFLSEYKLQVQLLVLFSYISEQ